MAKLTFADLKKMATQEPEEVYSKEAMCRLGSAFAELRECKDGKNFMETMRGIFLRMEAGQIHRDDVGVHTIIGICQLAHDIRDRVSPSRWKSFKRIIPWLIELRNRVQKNAPDDIVDFVIQRFEEWNRPAPSNIRPESIVIPGFWHID